MTILPQAVDLLALLGMLLVTAALVAAGAAWFERAKPPDHGMVAAWGAASLWLTVGGVFGIKLSYLVAALLVPALWAGLLLARRRWRPDPLFLTVMALLIPTLVIAAGKGPSEVDEFMHWLPNAAYLVEQDTFPSAAARGVSAYPAFPYNLAFVVFAVSGLSGQFAEQGIVLFNVVLGGVLALLLLRVSGGARAPSRWAAAALAVLGASALNPTFVPKIVFTNYADFATGVTLALAGFMLVALVRALREEDRPWAAAWHLGFVFVAIVNLKQSNVALLALMAIGVVILAAFEGRKVVGRLLALSPAWLGPAAIAYIAWRRYVGLHLAGIGENMIRPRAEWQVDAIPQILAAMGDVFLKKGGYLALVLVGLFIGVRGLLRRRDDMATRLAQLGLFVFAGYAAALFFLYVAHFPGESGRNAQSFWRYQTQLGPLFLLPLAALVGDFLARNAARLNPALKLGAAASIALVLLGPLVQAARIRFDLQPPKPQMEAIARQIRALVAPGNALALVAPAGLGEFDRFGFRLRDAGYSLQYWGGEPEVLLASHRAPGYVWLYCSMPGSAAARFDLPRGVSALLHHAPDGWTVIKTWPLGGREDARSKSGDCPT